MKETIARLKGTTARRLRKPLFTIPAVIALGSGGGRILARVKAPDGCLRVAVNSSQRDLALIEDKVDLAILAGDGRGSGMDPAKGLEDALNALDFIPEVIETKCRELGFDTPDLIPVIATLGHGFATGAIGGVLPVLKRVFPEAVLMPFTVTPFLFEEEGPLGRTHEALSALCKDFTCFVLSNETTAARTGIKYGELGIEAVYDAINSHIERVVSVLLDALPASEGIVQSLDRADLGKIITGELATICVTQAPLAADITVDKIKAAESVESLELTLASVKAAKAS